VKRCRPWLLGVVTYISSLRAYLATSPLEKLRNLQYGYLWWISTHPHKGKMVRAFFAGGNGSQLAMGIPDLDLFVATCVGNYSDTVQYEMQENVVPHYILPDRCAKLTSKRGGGNMRAPATVTCAVFLFCSCLTPAMTSEESKAQRAEALPYYGFDPSTALEARIGETPAAVLKGFKEAGLNPTAHVLTTVERQKLSNAFASLPPLNRRILRERLRSLSFLEGMPNTALTSTVNPGEPYKVFDITIRAGILGQDVSEFLTQKERTCFETANSSLNVFIEGGTLDAVVYVLLHESAHIVDGSLHITSEMGVGDQLDKSPATSLFTRNVWSSWRTPAPRYRNTLLERSRFYAEGKVLSIDRAEAVYKALSQTPFVSVYGSRNWLDDLAEVVTWYHLTDKLKQPYRIEIRKKGEVMFAYEPMRSPLVRSRLDQLKRFYESEQ